MTTVVLHDRTKTKLAAVQLDLPHGLLLTGEKGVGLRTIARWLAGKDTSAVIEPKDSKGNTNHETGTISVETIRTLYEQTRSKTIANSVIVIDDADRMSLGAQAAFLKLLEEPAQRVHFILTTHTPQAVLPTIKSRTQTVFIEPIDEIKTNDFLVRLGVHDARMSTQLTYLAGGLPAELQRLSDDTDYFNRRAEIMGDTRTFLTGSPYEKLRIVHAYHQDRAKSLRLVDSLLLVTYRGVRTKPSPNLVAKLERLLRAREKIEANCNIRLQLTALALQ